MSIGLALGLHLGAALRGGASPPLADWYDESFVNRRAIRIPNGNGTALTDYQVKIVLDGTDFDFASCQSDGSDLRITDADGTTLIPYWIEAFDQGGEEATIWARMPEIAASGDWVWLYSANPSPVAFDVPPLGPFTKSAANPILTSSTGTGKLAENIAYDAANDKYWWVYTDRELGARSRIGLAESDDLVTWTDLGVILDNTGLGAGTGADSPHLIKDGSTWYLFFHNTNVYYATASAPDGTWTVNTTPVLTPSALTGTPGNVGWETNRVTEVYVHKVGSLYYLWYMGDKGTWAEGCGGFVADNQEQCGFATAPAITGPYTKSALNPVIRYGDPGAFDSCSVPDPMAYDMGDGRTYIQYAASHTANYPWTQAVALTEDFVTFDKLGVVLSHGSQRIASPDEWDAANCHRGAISRFGDTYVFTYCGLPSRGTARFQSGLATQPAKSTASGFPPEQVFGFHEDFDTDGALPSQLRLDVLLATYGANPTPSNGGASCISGGVLGLTSGRGSLNQRPYVRILSAQEFGVGWVAEARIQHPNAATQTGVYAAGFGFGNDNFTPAYKTSWIPGKFGSAYSFHGNPTSIRIGNPDSLKITGNVSTGTAITVEFSMYLFSNTRGVSYIPSKNPGIAIFLTGASNHVGKINVSFNGSSTIATTSTCLSAADLNTWIDVAITYSTDGTTGVTRIFKNGVSLPVTGTFNGNIGTTANLYLGERGDATNWFDGAIDEMRISASERYTSDYTPAVAPFTTDADTRALWHFDENTGTVLDDASANGNDGAVIAQIGGRNTTHNVPYGRGMNIHHHDNAKWVASVAEIVGAETTLAEDVSAAYQTHRIWWYGEEAVWVQIEDGDWQEITENVPVGTLPLWIECNARADNVSNNSLNFQWVRVRRLAEHDPVPVLWSASESIAEIDYVVTSGGDTVVTSGGDTVVV